MPDLYGEEYMEIEVFTHELVNDEVLNRKIRLKTHRALAVKILRLFFNDPEGQASASQDSLDKLTPRELQFVERQFSIVNDRLEPMEAQEN